MPCRQPGRNSLANRLYRCLKPNDGFTLRPGVNVARRMDRADSPLAASRNFIGDWDELQDGRRAAVGEGEGKGGALFVDLDEAAHGCGGAVDGLIQVARDGGAGLAKEYQHSAELFRDKPIAWFENSGIPHSAGEFAMGAMVSAVMVPLSGLAIGAGLEEVVEAGHARKEIDRKEGAYARRIAGNKCVLQPRQAYGGVNAGIIAIGDEVEKFVRADDIMAREGRATCAFLKEQVGSDRRVGHASLSAGVSIMGKALADLGTKTAVMVTGGNPVAFGVAGAAGIAGGLALVPISSLSAFTLAVNLTIKSRKARDEFKEDRHLTEHKLAALKHEGDSAGYVADYLKFTHVKLAQHGNFYSSFANGNKGFLVGTTIYTSGVLGKVGLLAAVSVGGAVVAQPPVLIGLTALTMIGGTVMGFRSGHLLFGHGRQARYQGYRMGDDPELNRGYLAAMDLLPAKDPARGFKLRAHFYSKIASGETQRQTFLKTAASELGKRYDDEHIYSEANAGQAVRRYVDKYTAITDSLPSNGDSAEEIGNSTPGKETAGDSIQGKASSSDLENTVHPAQGKQSPSRSFPKPDWKARVIGGLRHVGDDFLGRLKAARAWITAALPFRRTTHLPHLPMTAKETAKDVWNASRSHLTKTSLKAWLTDAENRPRVVALLTSLIESQQTYLQEKISHEADDHFIMAAALESMKRAPSTWQSPSFGDAVNNLAADERYRQSGKSIDALRHNYAFDVLHARQNLDLLNSLEAIESDDPKESDDLEEPGDRKESNDWEKYIQTRLAVAIERFVALQQALPYDVHAQAPTFEASCGTLAQYLMKTAPARYPDLRGKLIETELQATRVMQSVDRTAPHHIRQTPAAVDVSEPRRRNLTRSSLN
jgi:hypothetical protein